jgi:hypothetical protein
MKWKPTPSNAVPPVTATSKPDSFPFPSDLAAQCLPSSP